MYHLTPQALQGPLPGSAPQLDKTQIQGDVLIGLQKNFERFVFFKITNVGEFKALLPRIVPFVTTTAEVESREFQLRDLKTSGSAQTLSLPGFNIAFTSGGLAKLKPESPIGDAAFQGGAVKAAPSLNDPVDAGGTPVGWLTPFTDGSIDGVMLVTGGTADVVETQGGTVTTMLASCIAVVHDEVGALRPGPERGHEHFGWQDGISQPAIDGITTTPFSGQRMIDPGRFVFAGTNAPALQEPWMANGSLMVFRRLKQLVPEFDAFIQQEAATLGMDPVLLGARLVGRWKSGAPLANTPMQDDTSVAADPNQNNNFDFLDDQAQRRCPFGAHIRKANPRADLDDQPANVDPRRIIRAGIPYGPEVSPAEAKAGTSAADRGLMFVSYQTSIRDQFEFVQVNWVNNPDFVFGKTRPAPPNEPVTVGQDPLIGQSPHPGAKTTDEPVPNYPVGAARSTLNEAQPFVVPTGAAYFFVPSIAALSTDLAR